MGFWEDNIDRLFRYQDKMPEIPPTHAKKLLTLESRGGYRAQQKIDGYRLAIMMAEGQVTACSRHRKTLPVSQKLLNPLLDMDIPEPAMLDAEWVKLRGGEKESIYLLDGLYIGGEWQGNRNIDERRETYYNEPLPEHIHTPLEVDCDFIQFLMDQIDTTMPPEKTISEGIVIKKADAKLIGNRSKSDKNPKWAKIKWRAGQGGDTIVLTREDLQTILEAVAQ